MGVPIQLTGTPRFLPMNQCVCLVKKMVMFSAVFLKYATLLSVSQLCAVFLHSCHFGCWLIISFLSCNSFFIILLFVPF